MVLSGLGRQVSGLSYLEDTLQNSAPKFSHPGKTGESIMIRIVYSGPCEYNRNMRGFASIELAYDGTCPLRAANRWMEKQNQNGAGVRLYSVVCNGTIYMDGN